MDQRAALGHWGVPTTAHYGTSKHCTWPYTTHNPQTASGGLPVGRVAIALVGRQPTATTTAPKRQRPANSPAAVPCPCQGREPPTSHHGRPKRQQTTPGDWHTTPAAFGGHWGGAGGANGTATCPCEFRRPGLPAGCAPDPKRGCTDPSGSPALRGVPTCPLGCGETTRALQRCRGWPDCAWSLSCPGWVCPGS